MLLHPRNVPAPAEIGQIIRRQNGRGPPENHCFSAIKCKIHKRLTGPAAECSKNFYTNPARPVSIS
jgi:hypothetical protein